jgi:MFS transporter, PAT family, beta-lactamase induction signal transducer AmpG
LHLCVAKAGNNCLTEPRAASRFILSESRNLRLFSFFLFYFGQGLPVGLTVAAIPAWMASNGVDDTSVGELVGLAYFAWTYKFILAALIDRYTWLPMGRRRSWLIGAQALMVGGFVWAAILNPGPTDYSVLMAVVMIVMTGAAAQDVAVDGLAVDILPEREQGTASGFMFGGQAFGAAAAAAGSGAGLQFLGAQTTFLLFIPVLLIPTAFAILIRERPGEKRMPWSEGQASPASLGMFVPRYLGSDGQLMITLRSLVRGSSLWYIFAQSLTRIAGGITTPLMPILGTSFLMMSTAEYTSTASSIDLVMALVGLVVGSWLTLKLGARWATVVDSTALCVLMLFLAFGQAFWTQHPVFMTVLALWALFVLLQSICSNPLRMQLSDKRVGATQFTIYNSLANLPVAAGAWLMGRLGGSENLELTLGVAAGLFAVAALAFAVLRMPKPEPAVEDTRDIVEPLGGEVAAKFD